MAGIYASAISGISTTSLSMAIEILIGRLFISFTLMCMVLFRFVLSRWVVLFCLFSFSTFYYNCLFFN